MSEVEQQFRDFMHDNRLPPADHVRIVADGARHGYDIAGEPRGSRKAWYTLYSDGVPNGRLGSQKHLGGDILKWKADCMAMPMPEGERHRRDQEVQQRKDAYSKEKKAKHDRAAAIANEIWGRSTRAPDNHVYLVRKRVRAHGLRVGNWPKFNRTVGHEVEIPGALLIPMQDIHGEIRALQAIFPGADNFLSRDKDFMAGAEKDGLFYPIGVPPERDSSAIILIGEGYATCSTLFEATGYFTVTAFDCGNLIHVAKLIRRQYRRANIVICADDDSHRPDNPGLSKAYAAAYAIGGKVAEPRKGA